MLVFLLDVLTMLVLIAFMVSCATVRLIECNVEVKADEKYTEVSACFLLFIVLMVLVCIIRSYIV